MQTGDTIFTSPTGDGTAILRRHPEPREGLAKCLVSFPVRNDPDRPVNHYNSDKSQWRIQRRGTGPRPPPPAYFFRQKEPEGPKKKNFLRPPPSPSSKGLDPLLKIPNMIF